MEDQRSGRREHRRTRSRVAAWALVGALASAALPATAIDLRVNSTRDLGDNSHGDGDCWTGGYVMIGQIGIFECTLRAAIEETNALSGTDLVEFWNSLPRTHDGNVIIVPGSNLPAITDPLIIDGTTISGYASGNPGGEPVVEIAGRLITPAITAEGLAFYEDADGSVVRGLSLVDFFECAVCVDGADAVVVESNRIGVRANGNADGTWGPGIRVIPSSAGTRIGDDFDPATGFIAAGNLLSANGAGIGDDGTGTLIAGNWVGLSPDGLTGAPWGNNLSYGVELGGSQTQLGRVEQLTGGGTVAAGNIITGNETGGVYVFLANDVQVRANWIGLSPDGLAAVGNGTGPGLDIADSSDVVVGDTGVGANVISGHLATGILLRDLLPQISQNGVQIVGNEIGANTLGTLGDPGNFGPGIEVLLGSDHSIRENLIGRNSTAGIWLREGSANVIQANHIGTNAAGDDLGNGSYGVLISGTSENVIGADVTSAAADVVQLGNTIGYNGDDGILLSVGPGLRNTFRGNRFHDTTNAPIDIAGAAANDPGDGDAGSNNLQNSPELDPTNMFFDPVLQQIGVDYLVDSAPLYTTYPIVVDFYSLAADGISPLEWIGSDTIPLAEASVLRTSVFTPEVPLAATDSIIAIATDDRGNSSEAGNVVFLPEPALFPALAVGAFGLLVSSRGRNPQATKREHEQP